MRPGPGDGEIMASQSDYTQVTRGGGHGDYRTIVYAPYSVQELCDYMQLSFEKAQQYCNPVVLVSDGNLAKLRESCELPERVTPPDPKTIPNALTGCKGRESRKVRTGLNGDTESRERNEALQAKFRLITENGVRYETYHVEDADVVLVVWGSFARVCISAVKKAREEGEGRRAEGRHDQDPAFNSVFPSCRILLLRFEQSFACVLLGRGPSGFSDRFSYDDRLCSHYQKKLPQ